MKLCYTMVKQKKTLRKKMKGGSTVEPETSGYKLNEGIGGLNDPIESIESSRLIKGGNKLIKKLSTKKVRRKTSKKKYVNKI